MSQWAVNCSRCEQRPHKKHDQLQRLRGVCFLVQRGRKKKGITYNAVSLEREEAEADECVAEHKLCIELLERPDDQSSYQHGLQRANRPQWAEQRTALDMHAETWRKHMHNICLKASLNYCCTHTNTHTHTQPFNGPLSGNTQVDRYQKKHSPTHTHPDHQTSFINFLHLLKSTPSPLLHGMTTEN